MSSGDKQMGIHATRGLQPWRGSRSMLPVELTMTGVLVVGILIAATATSVGFARAESLNAMVEPDTGLVVAMLAAAIGLMGALSAVAVRLAGRSRQR